MGRQLIANPREEALTSERKEKERHHFSKEAEQECEGFIQTHAVLHLKTDAFHPILFSLILFRTSLMSGEWQSWHRQGLFNEKM